MADNDIGYYTIPVILSMDGVTQQVNSKLGGIFGDIGKKGGADLGKGFGAGLKSTESDLKRATDAYEKFKDKALDALGKVRTAEAALEKAQKSSDPARIVAAEERLATARRNSTRATKESEAAHDHLSTSQVRLGRSTDIANRSLSGLGRSLEAISTRIPGLGGRIGEFGSRVTTGLGGIDAGGSKAATAMLAVGAAAGVATVGVGLLVAGAAVAVKQLYDLGAKFDNISDNFRITLGATGEQLAELNDRVQKLGPVLPSSLESIGTVVAEVHRNLKLTGTEAIAVTKALSEAGRMTGEAIDVKGFKKLATAFKIDGKDYVTTLDKIWSASQKTGIGMNELTSALRDAGPQFRALNLDVGESLALLAQLEDAGIETSEAVTALRNANSNAAEEGRDFNEYLQETFQRIRSLDEASSIELAENVFGKKGGQRFAEMIRSGELDLSKLKAMAAESGDTIAKAAQDTADWAEKWQKFKNAVAIGFAPVGTAVFDTINEKLGNLSDWILANRHAVVQFFTDLAVSILKFVQSTILVMADLATALSKILNAIDVALGPLVNFDTPELDALPDKLKAAAEGMNPVIEKTKDWGTNLANNMKFIDALTDKAVPELSAKSGKVTLQFDPEDKAQVEADLKEFGAHIEEIDGEMVVVADTDDAKKAVEAWRAAEAKKKAEVNVEAKMDPDAEKKIQGEVNKFKINVPLNGNMAVPFGMPSIVPGIGPAVSASGPANSAAVSGAAAAIEAQFPGKKFNFGGSRAPGEVAGDVEIGSKHLTGDALDVGINGDMALGDAVAAWAEKNKETLGITQILWRVKDHFDHVHLTFKPGVTPNLNAPGAPAPAAPAPNIPNPLAPVPAVSASSAAVPTVPLTPAGGGKYTSPNAAWAKLIELESSGDPTRVQGIVDENSGGNEAEGLFQITPKTWRAYKGTDFTPTPKTATAEQQAIVAARILHGNPSGRDWGPVRRGQVPGGGPALVAGLSTTTTTNGGAPGPSTPASSSSTAGHWITGPNGQPMFIADRSTQPFYGTPEDDYGGYGVPSPRPGYETAPPGSTWGTDQYGQYGYYAGVTAEQRESDAKAERDALKRIDDINKDIAEKQKDLATATGDQRIALQKQLDALNNETLPEAKRALQEAQKGAGEVGSFTEAKEAEKKKTKDSDSTSKLGELPGILVNGLLESIGIGDIFPNLLDTPGWKSIAAGITYFGTMGKNAAEGKLNFQQPGWQPEQSSDAVIDTGGSGGIPFPGLPNISLPSAPGSDVHLGTNAPPGPINPVSQDNSVNINYNGNVGHDPEEVRRQNERMIRSQNIPVGS